MISTMQCRITSASPGGKTESLVDSDAAGAATPQDLLLLVDRLKTNQKQSRAVIEGSYLNGFRCFLWYVRTSIVHNSLTYHDQIISHGDFSSAAPRPTTNCWKKELQTPVDVLSLVPDNLLSRAG